MANTLIQFRTDPEIQEKAAVICEKLGIDIPTYMRMCLARLVQENGIPFSLKVSTPKAQARIYQNAMNLAAEEADVYGTSKLSEEEINEEIAKVRKELRG